MWCTAEWCRTGEHVQLAALDPVVQLERGHNLAGALSSLLVLQKSDGCSTLVPHDDKLDSDVREVAPALNREEHQCEIALGLFF